MNNYFVDLHIHIGRTKTGKPVKITASKSLTLTNILKAAKFPKGLDIIGVIDCHSPEVIAEIEDLLFSGDLRELEEGGFRFQETVTLIPGVEIEVNDENCKGPIHVLGYFPTLDAIKKFSMWYQTKVKNVQLSTQRIHENAQTLQKMIKSLGGLFIPAHVFTPFKSLYGKGVEKSLTEILDPDLIDGIELGLSSNTEMADHIHELHRYTFVSNSDAHSLGKIAREYQVMKLESPTFSALQKSLHSVDGNEIVANYGLNPYLGKYYQTTCAKCFEPKTGEICPQCGSTQFTKGVSERIKELSTMETGPNRPAYIHQVPLDFLPGLGPKTLHKLLDYFGTEMNILHNVPLEELSRVVKPELADMIMHARLGTLPLTAGGGGQYGKVDNTK
ncbi:endonuclease Q family protein [Bacillus sp. FJAT-49736]|uniref:endonuclease Q family protein n=1 Tax=Bacillus sp. FJAT-49736 TaxID=2833582 RepID=UPI001BC9F417|nr:endonuclease Q family protein [Bacillus sp. FJAT-49736]MBS4173350.1 TIGR00375 family protein [Bacillus sp. FJAT-49736]